MIQSILVRVSERFELSGVDWIRHISQEQRESTHPTPHSTTESENKINRLDQWQNGKLGTNVAVSPFRALSCHHCTSFKFDGIKETSCNSGCKQVKNLANTSNCGRVCFLKTRPRFWTRKMYSLSFDKCYVILLAVKTFKVVAALKKAAMITSTYNLPFSCLS